MHYFEPQTISRRGRIHAKIANDCHQGDTHIEEQKIFVFDAFRCTKNGKFKSGMNTYGPPCIYNVCLRLLQMML